MANHVMDAATDKRQEREYRYRLTDEPDQREGKPDRDDDAEHQDSEQRPHARHRTRASGIEVVSATPLG